MYFLTYFNFSNGYRIRNEKNENFEVLKNKFPNDMIPELKTTAVVDGEKEICATEVFTLTDTVEYKHLIPNKEYTVKGV